MVKTEQSEEAEHLRQQLQELVKENEQLKSRHEQELKSATEEIQKQLEN